MLRCQIEMSRGAREPESGSGTVGRREPAAEAAALGPSTLSLSPHQTVMFVRRNLAYYLPVLFLVAR